MAPFYAAIWDTFTLRLTDQKVNEAYRIKLLTRWDEFLSGETYAGDFSHEQRNMLLLAELQEQIEERRSADQSLLHVLQQLNPRKFGLKTEREWQRILDKWQEYYCKMLPDIQSRRIDFICVIAFVSGQYFMHDPYRKILMNVAQDGKVIFNQDVWRQT